MITPTAANVGLASHFSQIWMLWTLDPCPKNEDVVITFPATNGLANVTRVEVFTTCPEPESLALVAIGLTLSTCYCYRRGWGSANRPA
jgi:hypothetical protein